MPREFTCYDDSQPHLLQSSAQGVPPLTRDGYEFDVRPDSNESEPPIDLPLHDRQAEVREERPAIEARVEEPARRERNLGTGIDLGMLFIGLLTGFGAGFMVGQRLALPAPPRAVEVPRPAPAGGTAPREDVRQPPVAPAPAQNFTESPVVEPLVAAPVEVREPEVEVPAPSQEPVARTTTPGRAGAAGAPSDGPRGEPDRARPTQAATVRFDSRPAGAAVYIDDVRVGTTPVTINTVSPGVHRVRLELPGHQPWTTSMAVKEGEQLFVGASLE